MTKSNKNTQAHAVQPLQWSMHTGTHACERAKQQDGAVSLGCTSQQENRDTENISKPDPLCDGEIMCRDMDHWDAMVILPSSVTVPQERQHIGQLLV